MISFIVAMDKNGGIGFNNGMPWHLPNDFKFFKNKTTNHTIIMGSKTFDSIGKVLPNRHHIVLTRSDRSFPKEVEVESNLTRVLEYYKNYEEEVFIIGGGHIFKETLDYADRLYVTKIDEAFDADVFFPEISSSVWQQTSCEKGLKDDKNPYDYYFIQYDRS
ncbi:MAG TPA: dihydrofolate reductase [Pseudogracilibacillus sp.]|nr:dihydrofolate reductase [Pseudogracilibacillus sp.]